jgi:Uma2 family endonuclease
MSLEEFLDLPEEEPALEFEDGEVIQKVSPKGKHSALQLGVADQINAQIRAKKIGRAFPELRASFADLSRVPDVSVYRWDRIARDESGEVANDFLEPPDIAIEIISPGQSPTRLFHRCLTFIRAGVRAAVLINPPDQSILVLRNGQLDQLLRRGDTLDLSDILEDLRLIVARLFDELMD